MDFNVNFGQEMSLSAFQLLVNCPDPVMRQVVKFTEIATRSRSVMITGETGVGKEIVAKAIHEKGPKNANRFVVVNCGNQNHDIMGSELFGHEKGAFTGANGRHIGFCEKANGGTLFLDEIGDLPLDLQTRLLRLLEDHSFNRVGGTEVIRSEFMVISATNHDLIKMVDDGGFRQDLFYRLNIFPIKVPPLRERPMDIAYFGQFFVKQCSSGMIRLSDEAVKLLNGYSWPGNVREMRNVIERAVILVNGNDDQRIHPCHLGLDRSSVMAKTTSENTESPVIPRPQTPLQYEYGSIRAAPFYHDWVRDPKDIEPEISAIKLAGCAYEYTLEEMLDGIKNLGKKLKDKEFRSRRWALYVAIYILVKDLKLDRKRIASFLSGISGEGSDLAGLIDNALTLVSKKSRCDPAVARDIDEIRAHFRKTFMGLSS